MRAQTLRVGGQLLSALRLDRWVTVYAPAPDNPGPVPRDDCTVLASPAPLAMVGPIGVVRVDGVFNSGVPR